MSLRLSTDPDVRMAREVLLTRTHLTPEGCLEFTGCRNSNGYGYLRVRGKMTGAHRFIYAALVGPLPARAPVHHRCANRPCINPQHLQRATHATNVLESMARNTLLRRIAELEELYATARETEVDLDEDHLWERLDAWRARSMALEAALATLAPHHPLLETP